VDAQPKSHFVGPLVQKIAQLNIKVQRNFKTKHRLWESKNIKPK
jgi:hypothetical protein